MRLAIARMAANDDAVLEVADTRMTQFQTRFDEWRMDKIDE